MDFSRELFKEGVMGNRHRLLRPVPEGKADPYDRDRDPHPGEEPHRILQTLKRVGKRMAILARTLPAKCYRNK